MTAGFNYVPGAMEAARDGHFSLGLENNRAFLSGSVQFEDSVPREYRDLLFDPQTSVGLLVAVEAGSAADALALLRQHGVPAPHWPCCGQTLAADFRRLNLGLALGW